MIIGNERIDLSPLFQLTSTRNFLLSSLNIFDGDGVTSHKVSVSRLLEDNTSLYNQPTARFSNQHNVTARQSGKEWLIELPFFMREDLIVPADIQGKRKPGSDIQETVTDIYSDYMNKHAVAFMRTRESYLARSLFSGQVRELLYLLRVASIAICVSALQWKRLSAMSAHWTKGT